MLPRPTHSAQRTPGTGSVRGEGTEYGGTFVHRVCEARRAGSGGGRCDAGAAARCPAGARPI